MGIRALPWLNGRVGGRLKFLRHPASAIVGLALVLMIPAVLRPPMTHDSFWITWVWADQFTGELARGNLYPRWLPRSHGGLGSPVFYYYPPLAFYVTGLLGLVGLSTYASILGAFFVGLAGSGLAMHAWLKDSAKVPLFGALLFMAAPYHLLDFYSRGALAEFLAIALLPMIALGLRRAAEGRLVLCACAYAALIMTHLPLALLASIFFIGPYALLLSRGAPSRLSRIGIPLAAGLAASAIYLLPAFALDPFRDRGSLWALPIFNPVNWSVLTWGQPDPFPRMKMTVVAIILTLLQPILVLLFTRQRAWGIYAGLCCVMAAALIPVLWTLPLLEIAQFPYRMLPLAEFAIATGLAHLSVSRLLLFAAAMPVIAPSMLFVFGRPMLDSSMPPALMARYPDVPENLPPGDRPYSWPSQWALDVAKRNPAAIELDGRTVARVFYFPAWEVRCAGATVQTQPDPVSKLLTYRGTRCERRLSRTRPERLGAAISLAALVAILLLGSLRARRAKPRSPVPRLS